MPEPRALRENANLAFCGEPPWMPALLNNFQAEALLRTANPSGRPNEDVLRPYTGWHSGQPRKRWQIDFPDHFTESEVLLYEGPASLLRQRTAAASIAANWWRNPQAIPPLRVALARIDRYLTAIRPAARVAPHTTWSWTESSLLPDDSLVAIVRDDDFTQGILHSREFALWWQTYATAASPIAAFEAFPFPWSPLAPLGGLTALQQELRYNIVRAARQQDPEAIRHAVSTAYGWAKGLSDAESLDRLHALHQRRAS